MPRPRRQQTDFGDPLRGPAGPPGVLVLPWAVAGGGRRRAPKDAPAENDTAGNRAVDRTRPKPRS